MRTADGTRAVAVAAVAALVGMIPSSAAARVVYLGDGAVQNPLWGAYEVTARGTCGGVTLAHPNRPECIASLIDAASSTECTTAGGAWSTNTSFCKDEVRVTQAECEAAAASGRLWSAALGGVCTVSMRGYDRNVATCVRLGGSYFTGQTACSGTWTAPPILAPSPGIVGYTRTGDQCLRCHTREQEYNNVAIRLVDSFIKTGHMNVGREVTTGLPWAGPDFTCYVAGLEAPGYHLEEDCELDGGLWMPASYYPSDDGGNPIDWTTGTINVAVNGVPTDAPLLWIYGDWLGPLPRAVYSAVAKTDGSPYVSYSCGRCHMTGWTSDATLMTAKEPETSFPGVSWDNVTRPADYKVNLKGGVTGDTNVYSSWDQWGITCNRCHDAVVDDTTHVAPAGRGGHHSNITATTNNNGFCSDPRFNAEAQCLAGDSSGPRVPQGIWFSACDLPTASTPALCTQAHATQAACEAVAATWIAVTPFCSNSSCTTSTCCAETSGTWQDGWCVTADAQATCSGGTPAKTWRASGSQAACQVAAGTWSFPSCSIPAMCSKPIAGQTNLTATKADCDAVGGNWTVLSTSSPFQCLDAGGVFTGNNFYRGQIIAARCMECHRQETVGMPYSDVGTAPGTFTTVHPGQQIKVGPAHGTVAAVSHAGGNQFLNSPHARFSGAFAEIGTSRNGTGYDSWFLEHAEAKKTGNGCTGCHDVHESMVGSVGHEGAIREWCQECHKEIDLAKVRHLAGLGTPLENALHEPGEACVSCHMPGGSHLFRVNTDVAYSTYPLAAMTSTVNANSTPDDTGFPAVWVDVDGACGKCHGGGTAHVLTTGTIAAGSKALTVASATNVAAGQRIAVAGAGARGAVLETYIASVAGTTVNLVGAAGTSVSDAAVEQNPVTEGTPYFTKAQLAPVAEGMHDAAPVTYPVTFSTSASLLAVTVTPSVGCASACPDFTYDWTWGDGEATLAVAAPGVQTHAYATAGSKAIALTVRTGGKSVGSVTRYVYLQPPDLPPTALNTCAWNADTWTMGFTDASTDDGPDGDALPGDGEATLRVLVDWGDGSRTAMSPGASVSHLYARAGAFTVKQTVFDAKSQTATATCAMSATPAPFTVSGVVQAAGGAPLASAWVGLYRGTTLLKSVYTSATGAFGFGLLKPATYTLQVKKYRYVFSSPTVTVGPSSTDNVITGTPLLLGVTSLRTYSGARATRFVER